MDAAAYRALLDRSRDIVTVVDDRGVIQYENAAVRHLLGYDPDDRIGTDVLDYIHPEDRGAVRATFESVVAGAAGADGAPDPVECRYRTAEAGCRWLESLVSDERDTVVGDYVVTSRDVQARKAAERGLDEHERRLEQLTGQSEDILWLTDADFEEVLFLNDRFEELYGLSADAIEADPRRFLELVHPDDRAVATRALAELADGDSVDVEYRFGPPEYDRWLWVRAGPVRDEDGQVYRLAGFGREVTERREREERLRRQNETLTLLARVLSHELRNDMNVIQAWLTEARGDAPPGLRDALEYCMEAGVHVVELTEDVRTLISIEHGPGDLSRGPVDLGRVLATEVDRARAAYPHAEIDGIGADPAADPGYDGAGEEAPDLSVERPVRVAAGPLVGVVVRNLINNAVQHNDTAPPTVDVSLGVDRETDTATFRIADDGPGLDDEHKLTAFKWSPENPDDPTAGLGLYLVATLVEGYDGDVRLADNNPRGTVAHVSLPLATGDGSD